jgi:biopolymer transport protein TolQ
MGITGMPVFHAFLLQINLLDLIDPRRPVPFAVFVLLIAASILSWAVALSKWGRIRKARDANGRFVRAFRKAPGLEAVAAASEQFPDAPVATVFEFGYGEIARQVKSKGTLINPLALERSLQLGISEEMTRLERNLNWLATIATVTPFIGLFGTVWGIIDAFQALSLATSASLRAVGPGIAEALIATAAGLGAAIPAAIFYNYFGHQMKEMSARMDDFSLEFLNLTERTFER